MRYDVHILAVVRVKRTGIEAENQEEAMKQAEESTDFHGIFDNRVEGDLAIEWAEDIDCFHVDEQGDTEYENSTWYDKYYCPL